MNIQHHPTDETLGRYSAGSLEAGPSVVVATHVIGCPSCRERVASFEAVGGVILEDIAPEQMTPDALDKALARLDAPHARRGVVAPRLPPRMLQDGIEAPESLRACDIGRWRWVGPGVHISRVSVAHAPDANVILLRVGAGRTLPEHGHTGVEYTQVLLGSFSDANGRYVAGDLTEAGADIEHQPIVDLGGVCICLAATDGAMRLRSWVGRLLQPLLGL